MVNAVLTLSRHARIMAVMLNSSGYSQDHLVQRNYALLGGIRAIESVTWVLIIAFFSGAIIGLTFASAEALDQGDSPFARMLWYPIYALILGFTLLRLPAVLRLVSRNPLIIVCVLWIGLTLFFGRLTRASPCGARSRC